MRKPYVGTDGYVLVHVPDHPFADANGNVKEHRLIAEKALGKILPKTATVHHHDEVKTHNVNHNLVICENSAYHSYLHKRARCLRAGYDPNNYRWCSDEKAYRPIVEFNKDGHQLDGLANRCKSCTKKKDAAYIAAHPGYSQLKHSRYYSANRKKVNAKKKAMRAAGLWKSGDGKFRSERNS